MPIYDFTCTKCGINLIDVLCKPIDLIRCPQCNEVMHRDFPIANFKLVGEGFYKPSLTKDD